MKFLIVTHVIHKKAGDHWYAYGPYVKEMNIWFRYVNEVRIIAPAMEAVPDRIDLPYEHKNITFIKVSLIRFTSFLSALRSFFKLPFIFFKVVRQMQWADHIHLRCPGNMGFIGCVAQLFFPAKVKTAKFAGNWDLQNRKRFTYRMQQVLIRNTAVTKNMTGLVYGVWPDRTKNIKPFFTATYTQEQNKPLVVRPLTGTIKLLFVGVLGDGKQPLFSAKVCYALLAQGIDAELHCYGEGNDRPLLERFIAKNKLSGKIHLHGNHPQTVVQEAFKNSHFLVFRGHNAEGWPKVVAEAMWWGCLPITSSISCVPEMVGFGERGDIVNDSVEETCKVIKSYLKNPAVYQEKCRKAAAWSRKYTLELFETEIKKIIQREGPSDN